MKRLRETNEGGYKYLGLLEYDRVKEQEMKDKFRSEYFSNAELSLKSKLNEGAVFILRYVVGELKWNKKWNEIYKKWTERPGNLWQWIKNCSQEVMLLGCMIGRGLILCENSVKSEENGIEWYTKQNIKPLLVAVRTSRTITQGNSWPWKIWEN